MNTFKQKRAVAKCKQLRNEHECPRECRFWHDSDKGRMPFCREAYAAERKGK